MRWAYGRGDEKEGLSQRFMRGPRFDPNPEPPRIFRRMGLDA